MYTTSQELEDTVKSLRRLTGIYGLAVDEKDFRLVYRNRTVDDFQIPITNAYESNEQLLRVVVDVIQLVQVAMERGELTRKKIRKKTRKK